MTCEKAIKICNNKKKVYHAGVCGNVIETGEKMFSLGRRRKKKLIDGSWTVERKREGNEREREEKNWLIRWRSRYWNIPRNFCWSFPEEAHRPNSRECMYINLTVECFFLWVVDEEKNRRRTPFVSITGRKGQKLPGCLKKIYIQYTQKAVQRHHHQREEGGPSGYCMTPSEREKALN